MGKLDNKEVISLLAKINRLDKMRKELQNSNIKLGRRDSVIPYYTDKDIELSREGVIDLIIDIHRESEKYKKRVFELTGQLYDEYIKDLSEYEKNFINFVGIADSFDFEVNSQDEINTQTDVKGFSVEEYNEEHNIKR